MKNAKLSILFGTMTLIGAFGGYFVPMPLHRGHALIEFSEVPPPPEDEMEDPDSVPKTLEAWLDAEAKAFDTDDFARVAMNDDEWRAVTWGRPNDLFQFRQSLSAIRPDGKRHLDILFVDPDERRAAVGAKRLAKAYEMRLAKLEGYQRGKIEKIVMNDQTLPPNVGRFMAGVYGAIVMAGLAFTVALITGQFEMKEEEAPNAESSS